MPVDSAMRSSDASPVGMRDTRSASSAVYSSASMARSVSFHGARTVKPVDRAAEIPVDVFRGEVSHAVPFQPARRPPSPFRARRYHHILRRSAAAYPAYGRDASGASHVPHRRVTAGEKPVLNW